MNNPLRQHNPIFARSVLAALLLAAGAAMGASTFIDDTHDESHGHAQPPAHAAPAPKPAPADAHADPVEKPTVRMGRASEPDHATRSASIPASTRTPRSAPKPADDQPGPPGPTTADGILTFLRDGNTRWADGSPDSPHTEPAHREQLAERGQKPFASILTCADSRVPPERLFDCGVGDLFVVRVAGNIAGVSETGTLEYGLEHLKTPVLVVMGHTRCGAVAAAASDAKFPGSLGTLVSAIGPAVDRARRTNPDAAEPDLVAAAVRENVWQTIFDLLRRSETCRAMVADGSVKVVGAVYDISSGRVQWLGEHPWQAELLAAIEARSSRTAETAEAEATPSNQHAPAHADADHR